MKKHIDKLMAKFGYYPERKFVSYAPISRWMEKHEPNICRATHAVGHGINHSIIPDYIKRELISKLINEMDITFYEDTDYEGRQKFIAEIIMLKPKK